MVSAQRERSQGYDIELARIGKKVVKFISFLIRAPSLLYVLSLSLMVILTSSIKGRTEWNAPFKVYRSMFISSMYSIYNISKRAGKWMSLCCTVDYK